MKDLNKAKIIYFMYKTKEANDNTYYIDPLEEVSNCIRRGFNNLKNADTIEIRKDIEIDIFRSASYPGNLWTHRLISIYQIYATIIGVLDARYDEYKKNLEFEKSFNNEDKIKLCEERIKLIIEKRNKIIEDYNEVVHTNKYDNIKRVISEIPSHKEFDKLCSDMTKSFNNQEGEFMKFYLIGYTKSLYFDEDDAIKLYNDLLADYKKTFLKKEYHRKLVKRLIPKDNN